MVTQSTHRNLGRIPFFRAQVLLCTSCIMALFILERRLTFRPNFVYYQINLQKLFICECVQDPWYSFVSPNEKNVQIMQPRVMQP